MPGELERHAASSGLHVEGFRVSRALQRGPRQSARDCAAAASDTVFRLPQPVPEDAVAEKLCARVRGAGAMLEGEGAGSARCAAGQWGLGLCGSVSRVVSLPSGRGLGSNAAGVAFAVPAWWVCGSTAGAQGGSGVPGPPMWTCASLGSPHSARRRLCAVLGASAGEAACTVGGRGARKVATGPWRVPTGWRALLGRGNLSSAGSESEPSRCGCLEVAVAGPPRRRSCKPAEDSGWALG